MKLFPQNKGYTLLFAVITAVLVMSAAAFIISVSRKEFILTSTARDSTYAVYAADSGIECAVENMVAGNFSTSSRPTSITCGDKKYMPNAQAMPVTYTETMDHSSGTSTFYLPLGADSGPCADIRVGLNSSYDSSGNYQVITIIESRGYNIGYNSSQNNCSTAGPRKVERAFRLVYQ